MLVNPAVIKNIYCRVTLLDAATSQPTEGGGGEKKKKRGGEYQDTVVVIYNVYEALI